MSRGKVQCAHRNIEITEYGTSFSTHAREGNGSWVSYNGVTMDLCGSVDVICPECGLQKQYTHSQVPKWIKALLDEIYKEQTK